MKATPHAKVLIDALIELRAIVDEEPSNALWVKRLKRVLNAAIQSASGPDPLMVAAVALAKSAKVLEGELDAAHQALRKGEIWMCVETPQRLKDAREAIAAARAAGVQL